MLQLRDFMPVNFLKKNTQAAAKACVFAWKKFEKEGADAPFSGSAYGRSLIVLTAHQRKKKNF